MKIQDWFDSLFEVKRKKQTGFTILGSFLLLMLVGNSLFFLLTYQKRAYEAFQVEYALVKDALNMYMSHADTPPLKEAISWDKEKDLAIFFEENNLSKSTSYYYLDLEALALATKPRKTYILDVERMVLYTSEFVSFGMRRWHLPGAN